MLKLYAPFVSVTFVATSVHEPLELFWRAMVAPAIGVPDVVLSVPLIVKFWLVSTAVTLASAVSVVGITTCTVTEGLVAGLRAVPEPAKVVR